MLGKLDTFIKYAFFGGIATIADWITFFILTYFLSINSIISVCISYIIGGIVKFLFAKNVVFKDKNKNSLKQISIFIVLNIISLSASMYLMHVFVNNFLVDKLISRAIITIIVLLFNYSGDKIVTFNDEVYE